MPRDLPHRTLNRQGRAPGATNKTARIGLGGEQVEGRRAVRELLSAKRRAVHAVFVATNLESSPLLVEIEELASKVGVRVQHLSADRLREIARTDAAQGVVAGADPIAPTDIDTLLSKDAATVPFLVVLDGVTDPHNLGAIARSALCAGATGLIVPRHRAVRITPTVTKAAAGAIEYLAVATVGGVSGFCEQLKRTGLWSIGLDAEASAELGSLAVLTAPVALIFGAEGAGLSPLVRRRSDVVASIRVAGPLGSLNVAAAAAVACFTVADRRASTRLVAN